MQPKIDLVQSFSTQRAQNQDQTLPVLFEILLKILKSDTNFIKMLALKGLRFSNQSLWFSENEGIYYFVAWLMPII